MEGLQELGPGPAPDGEIDHPRTRRVEDRVRRFVGQVSDDEFEDRSARRAGAGLSLKVPGRALAWKGGRKSELKAAALTVGLLGNSLL